MRLSKNSGEDALTIFVPIIEFDMRKFGNNGNVIGENKHILCNMKEIKGG